MFRIDSAGMRTRPCVSTTITATVRGRSVIDYLAGAVVIVAVCAFAAHAWHVIIPAGYAPQ
jgi:hypothetical protein